MFLHWQQVCENDLTCDLCDLTSHLTPLAWLISRTRLAWFSWQKILAISSTLKRLTVQVRVQLYCHVLCVRNTMKCLCSVATCVLYKQHTSPHNRTETSHTIHSTCNIQQQCAVCMDASAAQQPDCVCKEAVTETGGVWFDAPVMFLRWKEWEHSVSAVAGVPNDVLGFPFAVSGVDVMKLW